MDLIYADEKRKDIGMLESCSYDLAYGEDENDFECVITRANHCCKDNYIIYVENEEYGGIIDEIGVDTEKDEIKYCGRTWHGILDKKIICPDEGMDYATYAGNANEVLKEIIEKIGAGDLFKVEEEETDIYIDNYQMERYVSAYKGIRRMLRANNAKLKMHYRKGYVYLQAVSYCDYSTDEEFNTSQVDFSITKKYNIVNHLICMGQGDLKDRKIIHLFADENGNVQPYSLLDQPLQDDDYIVDHRNQVLVQENEITEKLDYPNAEAKKNYIMLDTEPADWSDDCNNYFYLKSDLQEDGSEKTSYESVEKEKKDVYKLIENKPGNWILNYDSYYMIDTEDGEYTGVKAVDAYVLQTGKPSDWGKNFGAYYKKNDEGKYTGVSGVDQYILLAKKPSNWDQKYNEYYQKEVDEYGNATGGYTGVSPRVEKKYVRQKEKPKNWNDYYSAYFYRYNDGYNKDEYRSISSVQKQHKEKQTKKPTDWAKGFKNYYMKDSNGKFKNVEGTGKGKKTAPKWRKNKYFTEITLTSVPSFNKQAVYREISTDYAPLWTGNTYYVKTEDNAPVWINNTYYTKNEKVAPEWNSGRYYAKEEAQFAPAWQAGIYYRQVLDYYATLVEKGLEKMQEYYNADVLDIDLEETEQVYDVGDMVGAMDEVTGIETVQEVTKKIISIKDNNTSITYEVGKYGS